MKKVILILAVVIIAAVAAYFFVFNGVKKSEETIPETTEFTAEEIVVNAPAEDIYMVREAEIASVTEEMNKCFTKQDCTPVFPSCCAEAMQPYFINISSKDAFIGMYKKVFNEPETCPEFSRCPRSFFGGAKADCINGVCAEAVFVEEIAGDIEIQSEQTGTKAVKKSYPVLEDPEPQNGMVSFSN